MSLGTAISRVTGYLRILALAAALGATKTTIFKGVEVRIADSYNLANIMPNMIYELIMGGVLSSLFIPIFIEYFTKEGEEEAWKVASIITNIGLLLLGLVTFLGFFFSYYLVRLQTILVSTQAITLANFFFKIFIFQIIFYGFCAIFTGILNSYRHFTMPAFAPIFNNIVVILTVVFFYLPLSRTNPHLALTFLALGTTLGVAIMALVQLPPLIKIGIRYQPAFNLFHPAVRKMALLGLPIMGYVITNMIGLTVSNNLAFQFRGGVTAYQYSWQFFQFPYGIFDVSISTALFPELSEHIARADLKKFKEVLSLGVRATGFIIIPAAVFLLVLNRQLIAVLLQHGHFDQYATQITAPVLAFFALGLFSFCAYMFLTRTYYSMQDSRTPLLTNSIGVPLNIILNIIFVRNFGVKGLALGHAITYTFTMTLLFYLLRKRIGSLGGRQILTSLGKFALSASLMGAVSYSVVRVISKLNLPSLAIQSLQLIGAFLLGISIYLFFNYLFKSEELIYLKKIGLRLVPFYGGESLR